MVQQFSAGVFEQKNVDAILVGLEKTAYQIDRCTAFEVLYTGGGSNASKNFAESVALHCNPEVPCQSYQDVEC